MDKLIKFMSHVDMVKVSCTETTNLVEEARKIHNTSPTATAALGRLLTMSVLMGTMMKNEEDKLTLQILGDGKAGQIIAVSNQKGEAKGYITNPEADLSLKANGKLDVGGIVGKGSLNIIKDIGLKEPYVGSVPLQTGEIAEDFAYYFAKSEQIPTVVALGVLVDKDLSVKRAGGYIIQVMPDTPDQIITLIENRVKESKSVTELLESGMTVEEMGAYITDDLGTYKVEELEPKYECDCSRERMEKALISIGKKDILDLAKDETTEIQCHFCNKKYQFNKEEMLKLI